MYHQDLFLPVVASSFVVRFPDWRKDPVALRGLIGAGAGAEHGRHAPGKQPNSLRDSHTRDIIVIHLDSDCYLSIYYFTSSQKESKKCYCLYTAT